MHATTGAVLTKLQALGIVTAVFGGSVIALPAIGTLQGNNYPNVSAFSGHFLVQQFGEYPGAYGAATFADGEAQVLFYGDGGD